MSTDSPAAYDVSVIVVTWNGAELTCRALESIRSSTLRIQPIVVDNGSTDDTIGRLRERFPDAESISLPNNCGFAAANNIGVQRVRSPLIMLMNNDAVAANGAIEALLVAATRLPWYDVFVPEMRRMHRSGEVDNRGIYLDRSGHCRQLDAGRDVSLSRETGEIFGGSGGACLLRTALVNQIGLFDETLESYWEDCDFAYRVRAAGHRAYFVPNAIILHEGSVTGSRIADRKLYLIQRNMLLVWLRWMPFNLFSGVTWLGLGFELLQIAKAILHGQVRVVLAAKRDALRAARTSSETAGIKSKSLLYWVGREIAPPSIESGDFGQ